MKVLLALAVLTTSAVSMASDRAIYDIMYLPDAGTTFGISTFEKLSGDIETDAGDTERNGMFLSQTLGHSISDRLSLAASLGYGKLETDPQPGANIEEKGLTDPTISARFRTMDETFRWDVIGGAVLGLSDHETEDNGDSDLYQGGHSLLIGTQVGTKTESFQWAILGQLTHNLEATNKVDGFLNSDVESETNNELLIRGDILNKLAEKTFLRSFLSTNFSEGINANDGDELKAARTTYALGTEVQQLFSEDLLLRAGIDYEMAQYNSAVVDSDKNLIFRLAANYQF